MRHVDVPDVLRIVHHLSDVLEICRSLGVGLSPRKSILVTTKTPYELMGRMLEGSLHLETIVVKSSSYEEVQRVTDAAFAERAFAILGVGGGKAIDVAKLSAHFARCKFISIPTQVSHDGIASPVSVIHHRKIGFTSVGASMPEAVIVPLDIVTTASAATIRSGIGDLLAKASSLRDWEIAVRAGKAVFDDYAAVMARAAVAHVEPFLAMPEDVLGRSSELMVAMVHGLLLSGLSMAIAGNSRPASGAEHLISHAIDELHGGLALHGEQVALGTIVTLILQDQVDVALKYVPLFRRIGLPTVWTDLGLSDTQFVDIIARAPLTRSERYTVLDEILKGKDSAKQVLELLREVLRSV